MRGGKEEGSFLKSPLLLVQDAAIVKTVIMSLSVADIKFCLNFVAVMK